MNIFVNIWKKIKKLFNKKQETLMIEEGKDFSNNNRREMFMESLKVSIEKITKKKKVETHICYGDGLGIKKKIEY